MEPSSKHLTIDQWYKQSQQNHDRVDVWNPANQLRLVVYEIIYRGFQKHPKGGWPWDFWTINSILQYIKQIHVQWDVNCWTHGYP